MRRVLLFVVFLFAAYPAYSTAAQFVQPAPGGGSYFGGTGGGPFQVDCQAGSVATGVQVRSGGWIDAIGLICRQFDRNQQRYTGPETLTPMAGGPGGSPVAARCKDGTVMIGMKVGFTRDGDHPKWLDYVQVDCGPPFSSATNVQCVSTGDGCQDQRPNDRGVRLSFNFAGGPDVSAPVKTLMGRSGRYVDAIGFRRAP